MYVLKSSVHPSKLAPLNTPPRAVHMSPEGCFNCSEAGPQVQLYRAHRLSDIFHCFCRQGFFYILIKVADIVVACELHCFLTEEMHQLYLTFKSDLGFLSVLLLLCSFKFKEDFQLVVIKNIDSRARSHRRLQEIWRQCWH